MPFHSFVFQRSKVISNCTSTIYHKYTQAQAQAHPRYTQILYQIKRKVDEWKSFMLWHTVFQAFSSFSVSFTRFKFRTANGRLMHKLIAIGGIKLLREFRKTEHTAKVNSKMPNENEIRKLKAKAKWILASGRRRTKRKINKKISLRKYFQFLLPRKRFLCF